MRPLYTLIINRWKLPIKDCVKEDSLTPAELLHSSPRCVLTTLRSSISPEKINIQVIFIHETLFHVIILTRAKYVNMHSNSKIYVRPTCLQQ